MWIVKLLKRVLTDQGSSAQWKQRAKNGSCREATKVESAQKVSSLVLFCFSAKDCLTKVHLGIIAARPIVDDKTYQPPHQIEQENNRYIELMMNILFS